MRTSTTITVMLSRLPLPSAALASELAAFFTASLLLPLFESSPLQHSTASKHARVRITALRSTHVPFIGMCHIMRMRGCRTQARHTAASPS